MSFSVRKRFVQNQPAQVSQYSLPDSAPHQSSRRCLPLLSQRQHGHARGFRGEVLALFGEVVLFDSLLPFGRRQVAAQQLPAMGGAVFVPEFFEELLDGQVAVLDGLLGRSPPGGQVDGHDRAGNGSA